MPIIARFHPQAWINDYAYAVDGDCEWDATQYVTTHYTRQDALAIRDDQYESDHLREDTTAPAIVRDWRGPFWIEVEESIREYYQPADDSTA